jgi:type IV secretory pathway TraG/TraD family ATPase VirD4
MRNRWIHGLLWTLPVSLLGFMPLWRLWAWMEKGVMEHNRSLSAFVLCSVVSGGFLLSIAILSPKKGSVSFSALALSAISAWLTCFYADVTTLALLTLTLGGTFSDGLSAYFSQEGAGYAVFLSAMLIALSIKAKNAYEKPVLFDRMKRQLPFLLFAFLIATPLLLALPLPLMNTILTVKTTSASLPLLPYLALFGLNVSAVISGGGFLLCAYKKRTLLNIPRFAWLKWINIGSGVFTLLFLNALINTVLSLSFFAKNAGLNLQGVLFMVKPLWLSFTLPMLPLFFAFISISLFRMRLKIKLFDETDKADETTGYFGSAVFLKPKEYEGSSLYKAEGQIPIGMDEQERLLFAPLHQKMTISPKGGGKSAGSSIPALLTYDGPVFVLDVKGELWATTARYRHEVMKRDVVVIDPFGVTRTPEFSKGKPEALLKEYHFNPFDWIPEKGEWRDRILNTLGASFVVAEEGAAIKHFDDNAKILIRGYIDYMMSLPKESRTLATLYELMSESVDDSISTFEKMALAGGRAKAAANQLARVGADERGSILSTSYRQIDWIGDRNLARCLSESNFDLKDFIKGNMDIFVVLPPDQTDEHNRLVRMLMALLLGLLVQTDPSELPAKKMLFLLDEIAQLGYCPDVEKCIEVLRSWGVVVWSVFQTLSQIDLFKKPDLFKLSEIKQIFTNDDTKTMEWIQTLGGKKTVVTKSVSTNKGQSKQKMQAFSTNTSSGEGESVQETGVDLLPLNEIREMPQDEQWIFMTGMRPIQCKKALYFKHPFFSGRFDENPLEKKRVSI